MMKKMRKSMMNKKLLAVVLGLSMALVACNGGKASTKSSTTAESIVDGKATEIDSEKDGTAAAKENTEGTTVAMEEQSITGGWSMHEGHFSPKDNQEAMKAFRKATEGMTGYRYEVLSVLGSQAVSGTNYAYLCKGEVVVPDASPVYLLLYVYEDLSGNAEVLGKKDIFSGSEEGMTGGFTLNTGKTELKDNEEVNVAFKKALEGITGVSYEPIAYLGSQVVSGTNYAVLCFEKASTASSETKLSIVTVYEDLEGHAEILSTEEVEFGV